MSFALESHLSFVNGILHFYFNHQNDFRSSFWSWQLTLWHRLGNYSRAIKDNLQSSSIRVEVVHLVLVKLLILNVCQGTKEEKGIAPPWNFLSGSAWTGNRNQCVTKTFRFKLKAKKKTEPSCFRSKTESRFSREKTANMIKILSRRSVILVLQFA